MIKEKFSVLVVDDETDIIEILKDEILSAFPQAFFISAENVIEATLKMNRQRFDVIISDVNLGEHKGTELVTMASNMAAEKKPSHFILISGGDIPRIPPHRIGKVTFFSKPIQPGAIVQTLKGFMQPDPAKPNSTAAKIDVDFINPFIESVLIVLKTMTNTESTKERIFLRKDETSLGDISAIVAMNSNQFLGSMSITFDQNCFLNVVSNMIGETYSEINSENQDAASELCNQIFGRAKKILNASGHTISPAIPSVIVGKGHRIKHTASGPCIAVQFKTDSGNFVVEAVIQAI